MGKLLQALSVLLTIAVVGSRDYLYAHGYHDDYLAIVGIGLAFVIFLFHRSMLPLLGIVVMAMAVTAGDESLMTFPFDKEMLVAAGMLVAGYAWWNGYR